MVARHEEPAAGVEGEDHARTARGREVLWLRRAGGEPLLRHSLPLPSYPFTLLLGLLLSLFLSLVYKRIKITKMLTL